MLYFGITLWIHLSGCAANKRTSKKWIWNWVYMKGACDYTILWRGLGHPLGMFAYAAMVSAAECMIGTSARGSCHLSACEFLYKDN